MFKSTRYLYAAARRPETARPFCLTVSLTHPHDPYTIHREYWDKYEGEDIPLPDVNIPKDEQDEHSKRLLQVCGLWDEDMPEEAIKRARRAYFGAMSYVDDNVGKLMRVLEECGMDEDTIVIFSADHGDMLGERGLWYVRQAGIDHSTVHASCLLSWTTTKLTHPGTRCLSMKPPLAYLSSSPTLKCSTPRPSTKVFLTSTSFPPSSTW